MYKIKQKVVKTGILGNYSFIEKVLFELSKIETVEVSGTCLLNEAENVKSKPLPNKTSNPFGLITVSDVLIIENTNENSFNLIIEAILNTKHVLIGSPWRLTLAELDKLEKLAEEAKTILAPVAFTPYFGILNKLKEITPRARLHSINCQHTEPVQKNDYNNISALFGHIYAACSITNAAVRKSFSKCIDLNSNEISCIKLWIEFDNGTLATIDSDYTSVAPIIIWKTYQNNAVYVCNLAQTEIQVINSENGSLIKMPPFRVEFENFLQFIFKAISNNNEIWQRNFAFSGSLSVFSKIDLCLS